MKKILMLIMLLCMALAGCGNDSKTDDNKLQVTASFYPMGEFVRNIGRDKVNVTVLVPDGAEAHGWEPSSKDLNKLAKSRVFVYNGGVEPWAKQSLQALSDCDIMAVEAAEGLTLSDGRPDPHVWVSPKKAMTEVQRITEALCRADSQNADYYQQNSKAYISELQKLDQQLADVSKKAPKKVFVTAHAAFGHLADDYGLKQVAVRGLSPEAEPTPAELKQILKIMQQEDVKYIFFETLTDPKIAEVLAKEAGAEVAVLDPLEGLNEQGRKENLTYLKIMQRNIDNLNTALNAK